MSCCVYRFLPARNGRFFSFEITYFHVITIFSYIETKSPETSLEGNFDFPIK